MEPFAETHIDAALDLSSRDDEISALPKSCVFQIFATRNKLLLGINFYFHHGRRIRVGRRSPYAAALVLRCRNLGGV